MQAFLRTIVSTKLPIGLHTLQERALCPLGVEFPIRVECPIRVESLKNKALSSCQLKMVTTTH